MVHELRHCVLATSPACVLRVIPSGEGVWTQVFGRSWLRLVAGEKGAVVGLVARETGRPKNLVAFGRQVRAHRDAVGWSQDQMGIKAHLSGTFIGKIERGEVRARREIAQSFDKLFGLPGSLEKLWEDLDLSSAFPVWFDWYKVEAETLRLISYQCLVMDGLLQTEDYARALLNGDEEMVAARMSRQAILTREDPPPPKIAALLTESVLYNPVGGPQVMHGQLEHLLNVSDSSLITVQIIPGMIPPAGSVGAFGLASMPDGTQLAYVDSARQGVTMSDPEDIEALTDAYHAIRSRALPVDMSRDLIIKVLEERWT